MTPRDQVNSKYAMWVVLDAFSRCFRAGAHAKRSIGGILRGICWVTLDLVMGWIMQASNAWNGVLRGCARMEIELALGNVTVNAHP